LQAEVGRRSLRVALMAWHCKVEDIQALLDGELDDRRRQECESHLAGCDYCARLMRRLGGVSGALAAVGAAAAPSDLRERVLEAVAQAEPVAELSCERAAEMASAYLDGELADPERDLLEAHLFACPSCYSVFKPTEAIVESLRSEMPAQAPQGLYRRVVAAVERERQRQAAGVRPRWRVAVGVAAGLAAAAAIVGAVFVSGSKEHEAARPPEPTVAERPATLETPGMPAAEGEGASTAEAEVAAAGVAGLGPSAAVTRQPEGRVIIPRADEGTAPSEEAAPPVPPPDEPAEGPPPAEPPMLARADGTERVAPVAEAADAGPEAPAHPVRVTTPPAGRGPVEEPVVVEVPGAVGPGEEASTGHESAPRPDPSTRIALAGAPEDEFGVRRRGYTPVYKPEGDDADTYEKAAARINERVRASRWPGAEPGIAF
jgi:anti-sigma factor RsiW